MAVLILSLSYLFISQLVYGTGNTSPIITYSPVGHAAVFPAVVAVAAPQELDSVSRIISDLGDGNSSSQYYSSIPSFLMAHSLIFSIVLKLFCKGFA
jgi:hypothetical protein